MSTVDQTSQLPDELPSFEPGWVWLAGAGPGDPGLLTLHALNGLRQADVVVYDALVDKSILSWAKPDALLDYAGKRGGKPSPKQRDITLKLIDYAKPVDVEKVKPRDLQDIRPGGLGVHIIREVMDEAEFKKPPEGVGNLLELTKKIG